MADAAPFTPLAERIDDLPLLLAGPIVRRVQPDQVTVWVAVRRAARVTLQIFDANGEVVVTGVRTTMDIGAHLHIVAVTAYADTPLAWGAVYGYDMSFDTGDRTPRQLFDAGVIARTETAARARLCYPRGPDRPTFVVPSASIDDLHLVHGSCRRPYLGGEDALPGLDVIIEAGINASTDDTPSTATRPQLMLFTGDSIYADGNYTPPTFTDMIGEAADTLLGWREHLPGVARCSSEISLSEYQSVHAEHMGHTEPQRYQLFSLGEFLVMYLYMLSDVIWPTDMPCNGPMTSLGQLRDGMPLIRRALANISTYAVFDDHEVTDDWNLTLDWCDRIYSRPLGRRVVHNGLAAFALVHGWGNTPEQFAESNTTSSADAHVHTPPGAELLARLQDWRPVAACGGLGAPGERALWRLLGVPDGPGALRRADRIPQLSPEQHALTWHFHIATPGYDILALDVRTRRAFPDDSPLDAPELLSDDALAQQIPHAESSRHPRLTLVVSAIPVINVDKTRLGRLREFLSYWSAGAIAWFRRTGSPRSYLMYGMDLGDQWRMDSASLRALLARLSPREHVLFLSGDLHLAYAAHMQYKNGDTRAQFAQMTSSGMFNEQPLNDRYHRYGYNQPWPFIARPRTRTGQLDDATYVIKYLRSNRTASPGRDVVGRNNLASVTFSRPPDADDADADDADADDADRALDAHQHTYWRERDGGELAPLSVFTVAYPPKRRSTR